MAWNLLALTSGPFAFGFALYWLISQVWWEGLAAVFVAPFVGIALITVATFLETLRTKPSAGIAPVGGILWAQSAGDVGGGIGPIA